MNPRIAIEEVIAQLGLEAKVAPTLGSGSPWSGLTKGADRDAWVLAHVAEDLSLLPGSGSSASGPLIWAPSGISSQESGRTFLLLGVLLSLFYVPLSGRARF